MLRTGSRRPSATADRLDVAHAAVDALAARASGRVVVKASGLAAGKGVTVALDPAEGRRGRDAAFATGEREVVVEEFLAGDEVSLLVVCDGRHALPLPLVEDHKAAYDGDEGPMTGGMGTLAPVDPWGPSGLEEAMRTVVAPTLEGLRDEGRPFVGTLFLGLMLTSDGPRCSSTTCASAIPSCRRSCRCCRATPSTCSTAPRTGASPASAGVAVRGVRVRRHGGRGLPRDGQDRRRDRRPRGPRARRRRVPRRHRARRGGTAGVRRRTACWA
jgi:hypothetical protein